MSDAGELTRPPRRGSMGRRAGWSLFALTSAALVSVTLFAISQRQSAADEIEALQNKLAKLEAMSAHLMSSAIQAEADEQMLWEVLGHCRTAEDIPDLGGNRIVMGHHSFGSIGFYVPEGSHALEINCEWKSAPGADPSPEPESPIPDGKKTWSVPLRSASGYWLKIKSERTDAPVGWELTGNHPEFHQQSDFLPMKRFSRRNTSWSRKKVVCFPNQVRRLMGLPDAALVRAGVEVLNATLRGPSDGEQFDVKYVARIVSEGPPCVSATDAINLIIAGKEDLLMPYQGGGKYEIRVSGDEVAGGPDAAGNSLTNSVDREDGPTTP